jgi:prevent-host-death family protein
MGVTDMAVRKAVVTTAGGLVRAFSHYSDVALGRPVVVTKNGRPRNVLISVEEYERLRASSQMAFPAADTPQQFLADIRATARAKKA